jgi:hypothetical protein
MKEAVLETKAVLTEVKDTLAASGGVFYTRKRYVRQLGRKRKLQTAKGGRT